MYNKRHLENKLSEMARHFKVVLLVGARQVGKSTILKHLFPGIKMIVFDPTQDLLGARSDPDLFLNNFPTPMILDEVQYAPELLPALKRKVDLSPDKGQYYLTGSQNLSVLKNIGESLAGRVGILHLEGMTPYEIAGQTNEIHWIETYLQDPNILISRFQGVLPNKLFEWIWRGSLPGLLELPNEIVPSYFSSYVQTYIERDVRLLENIQDLNELDRFLGLIAALTAQEINYAHIGREIGIAPSTAQRWLALLRHTYQWREISPYSGNTIKRFSKKSKGYYTDTGLICYLQRLSSPETLARHPLLGALFETFVVNIIFGLCNSLNLSPQFYHWRTNGGAEIDLLLERDGYLYPIEIKCKTVLNKRDASGLHAFYQSYANQKIMPGLIIYAGQTCYWVDNKTIAFPWNGLTNLGQFKPIV